jgi:hypothetical protein
MVTWVPTPTFDSIENSFDSRSRTVESGPCTLGKAILQRGLDVGDARALLSNVSCTSEERLQSAATAGAACAWDADDRRHHRHAAWRANSF